MRKLRLGLWFLLIAPLFAEDRLFLCGSITKSYFVGAKLPPSGLFLRSAAGAWEHLGYNHPFISAVDYDSRGTYYLAGGNGVIRVTREGRDWTILTGWEVTELRDIAVDRNAGDAIYFAHTAGIRVSRDRGATWSDADNGIPRKYTEAIRVDRTHTGRLVAGAETGIFYSDNGGKSWAPAGAAGFQVMHVEQSPHDACFWLAVTQLGGVFASRDCGRSFENLGNVGHGRNLYDVAFDPTHAGRIALGGWGPGVTVTEDGGKTWLSRATGLPRPDVTAVVFDPANSGRLYCSVHEQAVYVSDDAGATWRGAGMEGAAVRRMTFVP